MHVCGPELWWSCSASMCRAAAAHWQHAPVAQLRRLALGLWAHMEVAGGENVRSSRRSAHLAREQLISKRCGPRTLRVFPQNQGDC